MISKSDYEKVVFYTKKFNTGYIHVPSYLELLKNPRKLRMLFQWCHTDEGVRYWVDLLHSKPIDVSEL